MGTIDPCEWEKVPYVDMRVAAGRTVHLLPFWDGERWRLWHVLPRGLVEFPGSDLVLGQYVATDPADAEDLHLPFIDFMLQRASGSPIASHVRGIANDVQHLLAGVSKIRLVHREREAIGVHVASHFIVTEIEYLCTVARSTFDLLHGAILAIWAGVRLKDDQLDAKRREQSVSPRLSKVLLRSGEPRSADELAEKTPFSPALAAAYANVAPFFAMIRRTRDQIVHGLADDPMVMCAEAGPVVSRVRRPFSDFKGWTNDHALNDNDMVSLLPWLAHVVLTTIDACDELTTAFASEIAFPPPLFPGHRVFVRGVCDREYGQLLRARSGELAWWNADE